MEGGTSFLDARKSVEFALEAARSELAEAERTILERRQQVKQLEKALEAFNGEAKPKRRSVEWTPERRAAQAERMRQRRQNAVTA